MTVFANAINSSIGASISGATNTLTITNPSNTASSQALVNVTVGGGTAGDAFTTYTVSGVTNWSQGVDNSATDAFVLSASTALGTTNVMTAAVAGAVSFVLGNVDVTKSASGADVSITVSNTSNTASSTATEFITVAGATAGDAAVQAAVAGVTTWTWGIDNSASDAWVLAASTALGTTNVISAATTGELTFPLQSAFFAQLGTSVANVTGNGATFTLGTTTALTEIFDQNSDFNTNGTYTAPFSGRVQFSMAAYFTGCTLAVSTIPSFATSNNTIRTASYRPVSALDISMSFSCLCDMDAADTATCTVINLGEAADTDDINGSGSPFLTWFSGCKSV